MGTHSLRARRVCSIRFFREGLFVLTLNDGLHKATHHELGGEPNVLASGCVLQHMSSTNFLSIPQIVSIHNA